MTTKNTTKTKKTNSKTSPSTIYLVNDGGGKEGEAQEKASDQTQPTAEELRAAAAILNRASLKSNARKGFGTPAVKKKADATRARNSAIRRRLRREAIARAKLEAKAIIAKLDAEEKARG